MKEFHHLMTLNDLWNGFKKI